MGLSGLGNWFKKRIDNTSQLYDQVNPFDSGLSWQTRQVVQPQSVASQAGNIGKGIVAAPVQVANVAKAGAGGLFGLSKIGASSLFGSDQGYANTVSGVEQTLRRDMNPNAGLFGLGTPFRGGFNEGVAATPRNLAGKSINFGTQIGTMVAPIVPIKGLGMVGSRIANNAVQSGTGSAIAQAVDMGRIDPARVLRDTATGAALGEAIPGSIALGKGSIKVGKSQATAMKELAVGNPRPAKLSDGDVATINAYRQKMGTSALDENTYAGAVQALRKAGVQHTDVNKIDDLLGQFRTYQSRQRQLQGGYVGIPGKKSSLSDQGGKRPDDNLQKQIEVAHNAGNVNLEKQLVQKLPPDLRAGMGLQSSGLKAVVDPTTHKIMMVPEARSIKNPTKTEFPDESKLNTGRLDLDDESRKLLGNETIEIVDRLSNEEVQALARSAGIDTKTYPVEATRKKIAEQLNVRRDAVRLMNEANAATKKADKERLILQAAEQGRASRTQGTDIARQLQARKIIANELDTPEQKIFKLLDEAGVNPEVYAKRLADVDFKNPKEVIQAYRELVPAKFGNWVDTLRYNSMLSSPLTHAVNMFSNAVNVGVVAPIEKTLRGIFSSNYAAGEGLAYAKGSAGAIKQAADNFVEAMRGNSSATNLDLAEYSMPLAMGGIKGAVYQTLSPPMRLLTASDRFFRTLAGEGEKSALNLRESKGIRVKGNKAALAEAEAAYRVYQQDTDLKDQGFMLQGIDGITNSIMQARRTVPAMKWVLPFVKTPTNILKQGVEFSPLGFANAINAADKATALTRAAVGTAVFGTAAVMVGAGDITWGEPTNSEQRDAFRAEGKQPYSIRFGDKWVSFTKLPPAVSFPLALTSGIDDAVKNKKMSESTGDAIMEGVAKWGQFLGDQSYVKNIGDTLALFKGDAERATQAVANYPQQVVPFRALTGWLARMSDDTDRKVNTDMGYIDRQVQSLMMNYPGLRQNVDARIDPYTGQPLMANNPVLNAFSPLRITDDKGFGDTTGMNIDQRQMSRDMTPEQRQDFRQNIMVDKSKAATDKQEKAQLSKGMGNVQVASASSNPEIKQLSSGKFYAKVGDKFDTFDTQAKAEQAVIKNEFERSGEKIKVVGDKVYIKKKDGGIQEKPRIQYEFEQVESELDLNMNLAKDANNIGAWIGLASKKLEALEMKKQLYDPETEKDEINKILLAQDNIVDQIEKYEGYGGFTKAGGSKGGKGRKMAMPDINVSVSSDLQGPVVQKSAYRAPTVRLAKKGSPSVKVRGSKVKLNTPKKISRLA